MKTAYELAVGESLVGHVWRNLFLAEQEKKRFPGALVTVACVLAVGSNGGFGRHELMPIRTQANAVARYLGGYIRKQIENRNEVDKGSRLVRYIGFGPAERTHYPTFAWVVQGRPWRLALGEFAPSQGCSSFEDLTHKFGKAWSWGWGPLIMRDARLLEMFGAEVEDSFPDLVRAYWEFCVKIGLASVDLSKACAALARIPSPARILKLFAEMGDE